MSSYMLEKYNGWTNYETWCYNLHITNCEISYNDLYSRIENEIENSLCESISLDEVDLDEISYKLSKDLKNNFSDTFPENLSALHTDLLTSAIDEINWFEIATNLVNTVKGDLAYESRQA